MKALAFNPLGTALLALTLAGMAPRLWQDHALAATVNQLSLRLPIVSVVHPQPSDDHPLVLPASLEAIEQTVVSTRATGTVQRRLVNIGDRVRKGQLLAEIAAPEVDSQYRQSQANLAQARAGTRAAGASLEQQAALARQAQANLAQAGAKVSQSQADQSAASRMVGEARHTLESRRADQVRAESALVLARKTWQRWAHLVDEGAVTQQDADTRKSGYEQAQASLDSAGAAVRLAQEDLLARQDALRSAAAGVSQSLAAAAAAQEAISAVQAAHDAAQANLEAAQAQQAANLHNLQHQADEVGFERVVAPFDGVITSRNLDVGALVKADNVPTDNGPSGLFGIARIEVMRVLVQVPQSYMGVLRQHDPARLNVREFPERTFQGTVYRIAGGLDTASRSVQVEVHVPNPEGLLKPGMYVETVLSPLPSPLRGETAFDLKPSRPVLLIPATALIFGADGTRVATLSEQRRVHFVDIKVGRDLGSQLQVAGGLSQDMEVITNPTQDLSEGTAVEVSPK